MCVIPKQPRFATGFVVTLTAHAMFSQAPKHFGNGLWIYNIYRRSSVVGIDLVEHISELKFPFFTCHIANVRRTDDVVHL
jgi:hypothetical protein